ncbi:sensor histidine kinase [Phytomonospora endophytica]|uniref:histidine kinase n=1 Tax=Phytomonospora endophytica TaxID=714109 RepID=A0A841FXZ7_9ACTN|nr:sensor histidine kinase [Phytomonospora endophytica]MBB6037329.1 signal transduction histidine kinase [Phytomonospora endophytica]GIG69927.1 histidine kinase [Phytomonospora endophytica]
MTHPGVWRALARPHRWLASSWPWRGPVYLLSGLLLNLAALPGLVFGVLLGVGTAPIGLGLVILTGVVLVGVPAGMLERRRLRLMRVGPIPSPHTRPPAPGLMSWLRTRLREAATWRELAHALLNAIPLLVFDLMFIGNLLTAVIVLLFAPLITRDGGPLPFYDVTLTGTAQAWLATAAGVVLTVASAYVLTLYAAARAVLARALLAPRERETAEAVERLIGSRARLAHSFDAERRRIERDLHDGAQQQLTGLASTIGLARLQSAALPGAEDLTERLDRAADQVTDALGALRETVRGIHPRLLTDRGLPAAVHAVADRSRLPVTVDAELPGRPEPAVEAAAYFAVCELLGNATEHARATRALVRVRFENERLVVVVGDDGHGGARVVEPGPDAERGTGLIGITDRLAVHDGEVTVSSPHGGPTEITLEIPCRLTSR